MKTTLHRLAGGIEIVRSLPEHAEQLGELQRIVFPTLAEEELFRAEHYLHHIEMYPEGQFVALDNDRVVGMTTTIRLNFDFEHDGHTFSEIIQGGWLTSHNPNGKWLYGADVGTHPEYRRRGIARALYAARHQTVCAQGLEGQVTVGMMSGYGAVSDSMSPDEYYEQLRSGRLVDPTVSSQLRIGFEIRGLMKNYLNDPVCGNCGILIVLPAGSAVPFDQETQKDS